MLHRLNLSSILVSLHEEFVCLRREVVSMDQTIGIVCASCAIWRVVWTSTSSEVRSQDLISLALVALMDHTERRNDHEAVPVGGRFSPVQVVPEESVVGSVGIHHCVHPDRCSVQN